MSVQARQLYDIRNQSTQADGSLVYTCCEGQAPVPAWRLFDAMPDVAVAIRSSMIAQGVNADEPWCRGCSTVLEQVRDGFEEGGPAFISLIAAVASFIPGLGTAVAVVLRAGLSLAEGQDIDDAFIEGCKAAIPGGVVAEMAFNAGQAALRGESLEDIGIDALPLSSTIKDAIKVGLQIAEQIASGTPIAKILLDQAYAALPEYGQRAVDIAVAIEDGRSPAEIIVEQTQRDLPPWLQVGLTAGMAVGFAQNLQANVTPQGIGALGRIDTAPGNDELARRGSIMVRADSLAWHQSRLLSWPPQKVTNDEWRRGYFIGTAVSYGYSLAGPGQDVVRATMKSISEFNGFDAARALQYKQTLERQKAQAMSIVLRVIPNTAAEESRNADLSAQGLNIAMNNPTVATARALNADPGYKYGFDIGTAAAIGQTGNGAGKDEIRLSLGSRTPGPGAPNAFVANHGGGPAMQQGFDTAIQLQFGITKSGVVLSTHPAVAAGQLVTSGMIGTGTSPDQKAGAMTALASNPSTKAGAASVVNDQKSFFDKIWEFFGL